MFIYTILKILCAVGALINGSQGALSWTKPDTNNGEATVTIAENVAAGDWAGIEVEVAGATGTVTYSITDQTNENPFGIEDGKIVLTTGTPDYETSPSYVVTVQAADEEPKTATVSITINIGDVNDNPPEFSQNTYQFTISDGSVIDTTLGTVTAIDNDGTEANNVIVSYDLTEGNTNGDFTVSDAGQITTANAVDKTKTPIYELIVTATDSGTPALTGTTTVSVTVGETDGNGQLSWTKPTTTNGEATATVAEDLSTGALTGIELEVADATGTVTYSITEQTIENQFGIEDGATVIVLATGTLDYDISPVPSYVVKVQAVDTTNGGEPKTVTVRITINIVDVNDNAPIFAQNTYQFTLPDGSDKGTTLGTVTATDNDGTQVNNAIVSYEFTAGNTNDDFEVSNAGQITTANALNKTKTPSYKLVLKATDSGTSALTGTTTVSVTVGETDGNGNDKSGSSAVVANVLLIFLMISIMVVLGKV